MKNDELLTKITNNLRIVEKAYDLIVEKHPLLTIQWELSFAVEGLRDLRDEINKEITSDQ